MFVIFYNLSQVPETLIFCKFKPFASRYIENVTRFYVYFDVSQLIRYVDFLDSSSQSFLLCLKPQELLRFCAVMRTYCIDTSDNMGEGLVTADITIRHNIVFFHVFNKYVSVGFRSDRSRKVRQFCTIKQLTT